MRDGFESTLRLTPNHSYPPLRQYPHAVRSVGIHAARMPNYRRIWIPGGSYFFTVAVAERGTSLLTDHIGNLRQAFRTVRQARPFEITAMAVLPDHLHCIWTLPTGDSDYALRWAGIKAAFSASLPADRNLRDSLRRKRERGLWQRRYWEHVLRDERDLAAHVDYIHYNPVKHGLVECAAQWPYSSFHRYLRDGRLPAGCGDGAGSGEIWSGE